MKKDEIKWVYNIAYSYPATVDFSYDSISYIEKEKIEGDIVEMGVAQGAQIIAFKFALMDLGVNRKIRAFDSFCGIPLAGPKDTQQPGIGDITHDTSLSERERLKTSGVTSHSLEDVKRNFTGLGADLDDVFFYEGWFQDTLIVAAREIEKISILRLDGDLYESTWISMSYLYHKVSVGGLVIIDDWALDGCRRAIEDYFNMLGEATPEMICIDGHGVHYFIKK
jgi:O-methyltransferase